MTCGVPRGEQLAVGPPGEGGGQAALLPRGGPHALPLQAVEGEGARGERQGQDVHLGGVHLGGSRGDALGGETWRSRGKYVVEMRHSKHSEAAQLG